MISLGNCYRWGFGVEESKQLSFEWFQNSANKGDAEGLNWLGFCFEEGIGVEKNLSIAKQYFQESANKGSANGMFNLGEISSFFFCHSLPSLKK